MKIKTTLQAKLQEEEKQRIHYKKAYDIDDENVVVVEKNNTLKFIVRCLIKLLRLIINIAVFIFAFFGLVALLSPDIRSTLFHDMRQIVEQYLPFIQI